MRRKQSTIRHLCSVGLIFLFLFCCVTLNTSMIPYFYDASMAFIYIYVQTNQLELYQLELYQLELYQTNSANI
jgi:hypothetical protein